MTTTDNSRADALKDAVWRLKRDLERGNMGAGTCLVYMADLRTILAASPVEKPAPSPADERAAFEAWRDKRAFNMPSYGGLAEAYAWDAWQARAASANETAAEGADALAHEVWSAAQRAPGEGIEDAVQRIAAILSRSPAIAAEAVAIPAGWMLVPKHRGTKPLAELIIAASLACVENRLMEDDDRHELAQFADQLQRSPQQSPATNERSWTRKEIDGLLDDADRLSMHPGKAAGTIFDCARVIRELIAAPQPAQAGARVGLTDALRRAREELSIVEWENDPPSRVVKLFDEIDALLQGANHD